MTTLTQEEKNQAAAKRLARFIWGSEYVKVLTDEEIWEKVSDSDRQAIMELVGKIPPGRKLATQ